MALLLEFRGVVDITNYEATSKLKIADIHTFESKKAEPLSTHFFKISHLLF
jgi:hypothetical protein